MASPIPDSCAAVGEDPGPEVVVERGSFAIKVGDHQLRPAVAVQVATRYAHSRLVSPLRTGGHTGLQTNLFEVKTSSVSKEIVGVAVVGHEEIDELIAVEVGGDNAKSMTASLGTSR